MVASMRAQRLTRVGGYVYGLVNMVSSKDKQVQLCFGSEPSKHDMLINVVLILDQRRRRWANIKTTLVQRLMLLF